VARNLDEILPTYGVPPGYWEDREIKIFHETLREPREDWQSLISGPVIFAWSRIGANPNTMMRSCARRLWLREALRTRLRLVLLSGRKLKERHYGTQG